MLPDSDCRLLTPDSWQPSAYPDRQKLNAWDRAMLAVNHTLRSIGYPEFNTQTLVWLSDRVDMGRLRSAVGRLSRRHPVLAARLVETDADGPYWQFRDGAECSLHEITIGSLGHEPVWDYAGQLLSTPRDLTNADPIRFDLLHRPDGRDVFLMQYTHALMDNVDAVPTLRELNRLYRAEPDTPLAPRPPLPDLLAEYLGQFPRSRRMKAGLKSAYVRLRRLQWKPVRLGRNVAARTAPVRLRIATRALEPAETHAFERYVTETCGVVGLSMALVASVFRAIRKVVPRAPKENRNFVLGIGLDLCPAGIKRPVFQSVATVVPVYARAKDLQDRVALIQDLSRQFRELLERDADMGTIQQASEPTPGGFFRDAVVRCTMGRVIRHGYSLWCSYFASVAIGPHFCGIGIEDVRYTASSWPPIGITLLINRFGNRLLFQATYATESVSERLANDFLDALIADLKT